MKRFNGKRGKTKNKYVCWTKLKFHGCVRANGHRHTYTGTVFFEVSTEGIPKLKSNYGSFEEQLIIQIVKRKKTGKRQTKLITGQNKMVGSTQAHDARATTTAKDEENQIFRRKRERDKKKCWDKNRKKKKEKKGKRRWRGRF